MEKISPKQDLRRRFVALGVGVAALVVILKIPLPETLTTIDGAALSHAGKSAIAVLVFALVLWVTEAVPFHTTGLLAILLLAILRVGDFVDIVSLGFGSHIAVFMIGVLILSGFVGVTGLGKRITVLLLSLTGDRTRAVLFGFLAVGTLLSMWLSNMAVAAMLMPLARSILKDEGLVPRKSNFGRALMIACAWGPAIGGIGTPAGAGPNPLAIGFLSEMAGIDITFLKWMAFGVPAALVLLAPAWIVLIVVFPPGQSRLSRNSLDSELDSTKLGPMSRDEWITVVLSGLTVVLWLAAPIFEQALGIDIPVSMTVILTSSLFFFPGVSKVRWSTIESEIHWGSVVLVLSGISLGLALHSSGAAGWLSVLLLGGIAGFGPFASIITIIGIVSLLKVVFSSNSVTAAIVVPLMIALAQSAGLDVLRFALPAAITSSLGLILVTSAPTNVIPYSSGYFSIGDMAKAGTVLTLLAIPLVSVVVYLVGLVAGG